jgi:hypothetical protein
MDYDLQEKVEDALVALIETFMDSDMKAYPAFTTEEIEYPAVVVTAGDLGPISEDAEWHDVFELDGATVGVITEAAPLQDQSGAVLLTARERNAKARGTVLEGLSGRDLADRLNNVGVQGVIFSTAQVMSVSRDLVSDQRAFVTLITLYMIAEPKELDE